MRPALPALLLAAMLVTVGCLGVDPFGPSRPPSDERALDAVDRSRAAADVDSYRFAVDGRVEATGNGESLSVDLDGSGVVNASRRRMSATSRARGTTRSTYVTGDTAYTECPRMGWERENLTRSTPWLDYTPLGRQLALLDRSRVYWHGTGSVDGTDAAVVTARPTERELRAVADARGTGGPDLDDGNVRNVTVTAWIDVGTDRLLRTRTDVRVARRGATATATLTTRFTDYGEPVDVERPPFDRDALWGTGCPGA
jgi:hypothetical protein